MKTSKNFNRVVSGVLATSILGTSCTVYQPLDDNLYGEIQNGSELGKLAIPISLKLKSEDAIYIGAIQKVTNDIFKSPVKAKAFNDDPVSVLKKYGYDGQVNFEDNLLRLTRALADKEIISAIQKNDLSLYIKLCKEKGIISSSLGIFSDKFYQEQIDKISGSKEIKEFIDVLSKNKIFRSSVNNDVVEEPLLFFLPIFVAAAAIAAVVAYAAIGFVTWLYIDINTKWSGYWDGEVVALPTIPEGLIVGPEAPIVGPVAPILRTMPAPSVIPIDILEIYAMASKNKNTHIIIDNYLEEKVTETIALIKEIKPEIVDVNSEIELRNFIKINILNQLNKIE